MAIVLPDSSAGSLEQPFSVTLISLSLKLIERICGVLNVIPLHLVKVLIL